MMDLAFSPCPNDTFLFYAWAHGLVGPPVTPHLADIETLNQWALAQHHPVSKVSVACAAQLLTDYAICPAGAAIGFGCGPKLIAKSHFPLTDLASRRVAVPGQHTTAYHLLTHLCTPPASIRCCPYHEAPGLLACDAVDAAVIIHEHRFIFASMGFVEIADLGSLWEERYHLPLPLGCLVVRRDVTNLAASVQASLDYAYHHKEKVLPFVLRHSQHLEPDIVQQHIATYVNAETHQLSANGVKAMSLMLQRDASEWLWNE